MTYDAVANIEVVRKGKLWMVYSRDLPGNHAAGHTFREALERFAVGTEELFAIMMDDAEKGRQTENGKKQMLAFGKMLT